MENFHSLALPEALHKSIKHLNFTKPTEIQAQAIPVALEGHDIMGSAQTGTGKTGAFGIPLIAKLLNNPEGSAIVITPTRELATQVMKALQDMMGKKSGINTALLIGGDSMGKQMGQLRLRPRLYVGTPGRINDHLERGSLKLRDTDFMVLDEMDRMLDMGFSVQVEEILKHMPKKRQTLLFSATMPKNIIKIAEKYLRDPVRIAIGATHEPVKNIKQAIVQVDEKDKYTQLVTELEARTGSVIIFVKTKFGTERLAKKLRTDAHKADAIHGDLRHGKRERVIKDFRDSRFRILVATDVAARGLDIPHIEHVINYDLPQCPEDYIHRIGRTARAGAKGEALCLITPADRSKWNVIRRMLNNEDIEGFAEEPKSKGKSKGRKSFGGRGGSRDGAKSFSRDRDSSRAPSRSKAPRRDDSRRDSERWPKKESSRDDARTFSKDRDQERAPSAVRRAAPRDDARTFSRDSERAPSTRRAAPRDGGRDSTRTFSRDSERAPSAKRAAPRDGARTFSRDSERAPSAKRAAPRDGARTFSRDRDAGQGRGKSTPVKFFEKRQVRKSKSAA